MLKAYEANEHIAKNVVTFVVKQMEHTMHLRQLLILLLLAIFLQPIRLLSQSVKKKAVAVNSLKGAGATGAIKESEIKTDLFEMADDHFRGREAGTPDELKVSVWLAEKARAAGLKPAGDDGTYFQFFSLWRNRVASNSVFKIGDSNFQLWKEVLIAQTAPASLSAPIVFLGDPSGDVFNKTDIKGKAVAVMVSRDSINLDISLPERRYPGFVFRKYSPGLFARGASAIIFIADTLAERSWPEVLPQLSRGLYDIEGGMYENVLPKPPVFLVHADAIELLKKPGLILSTTINIERFEYPSVNVVGKIPGTDPVLSKEYVLYSGHQDHDGIRQPYGSDSIYNGADDNATVCVAMLAIARAFKQQNAKRSALFVWHGAEERGLLGSRWFSEHPTVPKESIVAVLNADMIGRNDPDSAVLMGAQPPHRNSEELVSMALAANDEGPKFKLDTLWDRPDHPEVWYFRSDHLPYARAGIPAIFFSTLLHSDYHTPMDEPKTIDMRKLTRVAQWMYRTGWKVANAGKRPGVDPYFKLER